MSDMTPLSNRQRVVQKHNRRKISLALGQTATAPIGQGQRKPPEDPRQTVIQARIRVCGATLQTALDAASQADDVTRCISAVINGQDDLRQDLRQLWATLLAITYQHQTLVLGRPAGPQCSAMPMTSEPMQTDQSHTIDTRTIEERIADAKRNHRHWWRIIESLPVPNMIWAIRSALGGGIGGLGAEVWQGEQPTRRGVLLVNALLLLHRAVK